MRKFFGGVLFILVFHLPLIGIAQTPPEGFSPPVPTVENAPFPPPAPPVPPEERSLFDQARAAFDKGDREGALALYEQFPIKFPESALLPDVYLQLSAIYTQKGDSKKSIDMHKIILEKFPDFDRKSLVRSELSDLYLAAGDLEGVRAFWRELPGEEASKIAAYEKVSRAYVEKKEYDNALHVLLDERALLIDPITNEAVRSRIVSIVQEKLEERELQSLEQQFPSDFPGDEAAIRLIGFYAAKGDHFREEREINRFLSVFQNHPYAGTAKNRIGQIRDQLKANRYLIAVLLPLSGRPAPFGLSALNGAQLALQQFKESAPGASVDLVIRDSDDETLRSRGGLEGWLSDYRPVAMVGPLLSKEVDRVAPIVEKQGLVLITPGATAPHLVSLGKAVFRNATTTSAQCHAIAEYAVSQLDLKHFAILYPKESYGMEWVNCFSEEAVKLGAEIVHAEPYPVNETDFTLPIRRLKEADLKKEGVSEVEPSGKGKRETFYEPGFDALFLPGDAQKVGLIIPQLVFHNINEVRFLGTSGWNTPELLKMVGPYAEGGIFIDGFFQGSPDPMIRKFVTQYSAKFQQDPDLFAAQAYDALRLILAALEGGATTAREVKNALANTKNFQGVSGHISEIQGGEIIKKPFMIQVQNGKLVQIN